MTIQTRPLRETEVALVPYDNNIFFVIRLDRKLNEKQMYKTQLWNKETDSYGETSYLLTYYQARQRLSYVIK